MVDAESLLRASTFEKAYIKVYERENAANVLQKLRHVATSLSNELAAEKVNSEQLRAGLMEALKSNDNARARIEALTRQLHEQDAVRRTSSASTEQPRSSPNIRVKGTELLAMWNMLETSLHETTFSAVGKLIGKIN